MLIRPFVNFPVIIPIQDDAVIVSYINTHPIQSTLVPFSLRKKVENGTYLEQNNILIEFNNRDIIMSTTNLALEGKHNIKNAMAASTVAHLLKINCIYLFCLICML